VGNAVNVQPASRSYEIRGSASQICRAIFAPGQTSILFGHCDVPDVQHQHLRRVPQPATVWVPTSSARGQVRDERHHRSHRVLQQHDRLYSVGSLPRSRSRETNANPRLAGVLFHHDGVFRELRATKSATTDLDTSLDRLDVAPLLRYPFKKWQWFTVNSTIGWRDTFYTRSYSPTGQVIDDTLNPPALHAAVADRPARVQ